MRVRLQAWVRMCWPAWGAGVCYLIIKTGYDMTREVRVLSTRLWVGVMGHERTQTRRQGGESTVRHVRTGTNDDGRVGAVGHERTWARDRGRDKRARADARDESGVGYGSV